jgi:outer membrane protein assembly factor BamB
MRRATPGILTGSAVWNAATRLLLIGGLCLLAGSPVQALVTRLTPLADVMKESTFIITAKVDSLDKDRPAMVLLVDEVLKGKFTGKKLPVLLKGDPGAVKRKESAKLLARLEPKLRLVLFLTARGEGQIAFAYSNGTWFSMDGVKVDGEWRWSFSHLEPYLRRTYKGTTAEMIETVRDGLSGKRKPPAVDSKAKPGLGPEVGAKKTSQATAPWHEPKGAVVPTVLIGGPLAMLAMLFPTVFGGWKRWLALLSTVGTTSTLLTLHWWKGDALVGSWWGTPTALWAVMTAVTAVGMAWAWNRHTQRVQSGEAPLIAGPLETAVLLGAAVAGMVGLLVGQWVFGHRIRDLAGDKQWWPVVGFVAALWIGAIYVLWTRLRGPRMIPALGTEAVVLTGLVVVSIFLGTGLRKTARAGGLESSSGPRLHQVWTFRLPSKGAILSSPLVVGDRVYVAAAHEDIFRPYGAVYCLDRATGAVRWSFSDKAKMKQVYSSPVVVGDRLYIGEGFHEDSDCRIFCLGAEKGAKLWEYATGSHTESTPCVVDGRLYCGAGDDGLYCLNAEDGKELWKFSSFHIDSTPVSAYGSVYAGCGIGDAFKETAVLCLDAGTGKPRWRYNTQLPVWSRVVVSGGYVYAGMGNGRVNETDDNPAGAVVCLSANKGEEKWKRKLPDGVLGRLAADKRRLFVGCRDGYLYCLRQSNGSQVYRYDMGSSVLAGPVLERDPSGEGAERVYVASKAGSLACLEPSTGHAIWRYEIGDETTPEIELVATPALEVIATKDGNELRRLYVGLTLLSTGRIGELHCYEEKQQPTARSEP